MKENILIKEEFKSLTKEIFIDKKEDKSDKFNTLLFSKKFLNIIKIIVIFFSLMFFIRTIHIFNLKEDIIMNNKDICYKEENFNFKGYTSSIKPIAFYHLENENISNINNKEIVKNLTDQINFAKNHGIYGYGFYFFLNIKNIIYNKHIEIFLENENLNIPFLLILKTNGIIDEKGDSIDFDKISLNLTKYILDKRYIKIDNKPVIMLNHDKIDEIKIENIRRSFKNNKFGEIFILSNIDEKNMNDKNKNDKRGSDGQYYLASLGELPRVNLYYKELYSYFYTHLLYHDKEIFSNIANNNIFRSSISINKYPIYDREVNNILYEDYNPVKFYFLNKLVFNWTMENHSKDNQYIFIDNFNYLLPNEFLGYANINSFCKALYNLPMISNDYYNFNLVELKKSVSVLAHIHLYYTELMEEIIEKTNNIPVPFDLYITTNTEEKKNIIENYIKINSKAHKYEILITKNKGRDIMPFIIQLKDKWKKYKYLCHLHTKKHGYLGGDEWRDYLYENLLGNKTIISKILSDFENNKKLGLIYPECFYKHLSYIFYVHKNHRKFLNHILELLFKKAYNNKGVIEFPVGNMFWARTDAIRQIFDMKLYEICPEEKGQFDDTLLHAIERSWNYIAQLNGYNYKTIFYTF